MEPVQEKKPPVPVITLDQYLMGRDKIYPSEYTKEIETNAIALLSKVNEFLLEIGIKKAEVSSGWRPAAINSKLANAAKKSAHMIGMAIDLKDKDGKLKQIILDNIHLLPKYGLWLEDPSSTVGWVHLDTKIRSVREKNIFKP